jgi:hypothetical protein
MSRFEPSACRHFSFQNVPAGRGFRSAALLGLAIAKGRLSTPSVIAAITVISSIAAVPVLFTRFGRRAIAVPIPPLVLSDDREDFADIAGSQSTAVPALSGRPSGSPAASIDR